MHQPSYVRILRQKMMFIPMWKRKKFGNQTTKTREKVILKKYFIKRENERNATMQGSGWETDKRGEAYANVK